MSLQRNFSFTSRDDDPSYHPLPTSESPPRPPPHRTSLLMATPPPTDHAPLPRRMDSSSSSSSSSDDYDEDEDEDNPFSQRQASVIRKPVPEAAAALAPPVPPHNADERGLTPTAGYREDERFWGREIGYSRSIVGTPFPDAEETAHYTPTSSNTPASQVPLMQPNRPPQPPPHTQNTGSPDRILRDPLAGHYTDNPYKRFSTTFDPILMQSGVPGDGAHDILSDDDEHEARGAPAAGGVMGALGAMVGRKRSSSKVLATATAADVAGGAGNLRGGAAGNNGLLGRSAPDNEKSDWLASQKRGNRRTRWIVGVVVVFIFAGIIAGTVAGVLVSRQQSGSSSSNSPGGLSASEDVKQNGDLNKDSPEIKDLMNNSNLHKVFHGMDYTPFNAVYPDCLTNPPTQNNITRDMAVMSLLTNKVRLYGNDCNQTAMVLHAIDALQIDMKVWLGVWLDNNSTTRDRQLSQFYDIVDDSAHVKYFDGVAVGNEVLFRKDLTQTELFDIISGVKSNLTSRNINIPVGTSDLGDNWNAQMASQVDIVMANVHPFFAGVTIDVAANWTMSFFDTHDVVLTDGLSPKPKAMISEVGWPSGGGSDEGSVAGISEMNQLLSEFVCQQNANGTEYFWFSPFDEPWKVMYNTPGKEWEDKWGLMDVNRNLKNGVTIPSC